MTKFQPKISKELLDKLVLYMNDRPYREVAGLLSELYAEVQGQLPKPKADRIDKAEKIIRNSTRPSLNGHYGKEP